LREPERGQHDGVATGRDDYSLREALTHLLSQPVYVAAVFALAVFSFGGTAFEVWAPTYLIRSHDMGTANAGAWAGIIETVSGIAGTLCGGLLADKLGRRDERWYLWVPALAVVLLIPIALTFLFASGAWLFPLYFCATLCLACYMAPLVAAALSVMPARLRALASAVLFLVLNLVGSGGGPFVAGVLSDALRASYGEGAIRYAIAGTLLISLAGIPLALFAADRLKRPLRETH
jgi:MFS family permease